MNIAKPATRLAALRFASTAPPASVDPSTISPSPVDPPPITEATPALDDDFVSPALDEITSDLPSIPEKLGYLKELGLDYGWGPTAFVEWLLEHVHVFCGTPWWASVILTAVVVRLALLKPYIEAADTSARIATIQESVKPIQVRLKVARNKKDQTAMILAAQELKSLYKSAGIKLWKIAIPFVQAPIGYGTFRLFRGMTSLPVPGLDDGGFLWIRDLTISDPYSILPVLTGVAIHYTFKVSIHELK